jgi:hypothetical protein
MSNSERNCIVVAASDERWRYIFVKTLGVVYILGILNIQRRDTTEKRELQA